ncbi:MAG: hypothetical protein ACYTKD_03430 [Planctomycetota bacterium]|jgi:hypothetical protein
MLFVGLEIMGRGRKRRSIAIEYFRGWPASPEREPQHETQGVNVVFRGYEG